jgi:hypothetical protein
MHPYCNIERVHAMKSIFLKSLVFVALAGAASLALRAQEVVHAVSGTVTAVDPAKSYFTIQITDGSYKTFNLQKGSTRKIEYDKSIRDGASDPASFNKIGDHVVAYYFNDSSGQTIVGVKDYGPNGLSTASGTVARGGKHQIELKTDAGTIQTFEIANDASVETSEGVVSGSKFEAQDGAHVTVRYLQSNGAQVAQFISAD